MTGLILAAVDPKKEENIVKDKDKENLRKESPGILESEYLITGDHLGPLIVL